MSVSSSQIQSMMEELGLKGMMEAYERSLSHPDYVQLSFEERLYHLLSGEQNAKENRRIKRLMSLAKFKEPSASLDQLQYGAGRSLDKSLIFSLSSNDWIERQQNILITGATGTGKSFLAQALGKNAIHQGYSTRYYRVTRLLEDIKMARHVGHYTKMLTQVARHKLLILDDFGVSPLTNDDVTDLFEVIEERTLRGSTIITAQLPIKEWHAYLGNETMADAILDRLVHRSFKIELKIKDSMRKIMADQEEYSNTQDTMPTGNSEEKPLSE